MQKQTNNIILGKRRLGILNLKEQLTPAQLNHHVHIVGASGFGKTVMLLHILKQKIECKEGVLFIDLKNDMDTLSKLQSYVKSAGRERDLQIFSLSDKTLSLPYNLVSEGTASQLTDRIMLSLTWSEEYYKNQSASFLLKLLTGLVYLRQQGMPFTLGEILKATTDKDYVSELTAKVPDIGALQIRKMLEECSEFLIDNGTYKSLQGLRSQLESLVLSDFGNLVSSNKEGLSLFESYRQKKIIFLFLDSRRYGESAKVVGKFIIQDLKATTAKIDAELSVGARRQFTCVIDEFADLASEDFIGFLDRARSSKMSIVVAHQELSDLKRVSPQFANRLISNTSTLYAFLQKVPESAEMIAGIAGTRKAWKSTRQTERLWLFEIDSGKGSKREVEEFNIHPNTIKSLKVGHCVCVKKYPEAKSYLIKVNRGA